MKMIRSLGGCLCLTLTLGPVVARPASGAVPTYRQGSNSASDEDWLAQAKEAETARDFARAAQCYASFLKEHPGRADILQRLGLVYYLSNRFETAIPPLERALELDRHLWGAALFLGISDYRCAQFEKALVALRSVLRIKPDLSEAHFWLGSALLALGKNEEAAVELETVPTGSSEKTDAEYMLAQAYRRAAESFYERIEKLNSDSYRAHQLEAESLAWRGQGQKAILEYRKALERKPDLEGAHRGIADLYWEQGAFDRAAREYEAELRFFPLDDHAQVKVGEYWLAQGDAVRAIIQYLEPAVRVNIDSGEGFRALGQAWMQRGDLAKAESSLKAAIQRDPLDPISHRLLAEVYRKTARPELAESEYNLMERLSANEKEARGQKPEVEGRESVR